MKALVTGASGFIGSHLIEELGTLGFDVHALMRASSKSQNLEGLKFRSFEGDLSDEKSLKKAVKGMDYVFHLAGAISARNEEEFFESNAKGTQRLARATADSGARLSRFVFVSSLAAAGPAYSLKPRTEADPEKPVSDYGKSKLAGERELLKYKENFPISIIRPPIVYGPKDKGVYSLVKTITRNLMPILPGSGPGGKRYYSSIHVRDLCKGIVQAAVVSPAKVPSGEAFFMAADGVHTYEEFLGTIAECLDRDPLRFRVPKIAVKAAAWGMTGATLITRKTFPLTLDKLNEIFQDYWICSNSKAKKMLGFAPELDLTAGMSDAIRWYKRQKWI